MNEVKSYDEPNTKTTIFATPMDELTPEDLSDGREKPLVVAKYLISEGLTNDPPSKETGILPINGDAQFAILFLRHLAYRTQRQVENCRVAGTLDKEYFTITLQALEQHLLYYWIQDHNITLDNLPCSAILSWIATTPALVSSAHAIASGPEDLLWSNIVERLLDAKIKNFLAILEASAWGALASYTELKNTQMKQDVRPKEPRV